MWEMRIMSGLGQQYISWLSSFDADYLPKAPSSKEAFQKIWCACVTNDIGLCAKLLIFVVFYEISMYGICITGHLDIRVVKIL